MREGKTKQVATAEHTFLWGVSTSGYQCEGGYNGEGQPQTNWAVAEATGHAAHSGGASEFWTRYDSDFGLARNLGLNAFRLGIEWSRVQPCQRPDSREEPGFDEEALEHYADILAACRHRGLEPVLTLHHFVHPAWMGPDPWLDEATVDRFVRYTEFALDYLNTRLQERNLAPVRYLLTINEPNMLVLNTYIGRQFPSAARAGFGNILRAYDTLLAAHVRAYNAIHDLYVRRDWQRPFVATNNYCSDLYWSDKLLLDLLCVRRRGVARADVAQYIHERAIAFSRAFKEERLITHRELPVLLGGFVKWLSNTVGWRTFRADAFSAALDAVYSAPRESSMDYIALDYYDPFLAHSFRLPRWTDLEIKSRSFRSWMMNTVTSKWWDWRVLPRGLYFFCRHYSSDFGLPVLVAENGMALGVRWDNTPLPRRDRMTRSKFLRLHVHEVQRARRDGTSLIGYFHWSLCDNYEWGSFTPRFGLYSLDYTKSADRLKTDPLGDTPSATYAELIADGDGE